MNLSKEEIEEWICKNLSGQTMCSFMLLMK